MSLAAGTRLGPYEILSALGAGGMGEVYRARDTKLNRDVALKVLPDSFATDPDRLARFQREAQVLASLNHPNIAHIHGLEDSGGVRALVMELVEGEDLAQRLTRGAIPIDEALPIAKQIAEALEAAHEQGIIHRDLKPANVKVRPDGTVKVLDFGLAKAMDPAGSSPNVSQSPTIATPAMTQAGMILGTAAYMSPEQVKGREADKRADVWAFGCVLYEMLAGVRAFKGEDIAETLANILKDEANWTLLPADARAGRVREVLEGCLKRDRAARISDIAVVRYLLTENSNASYVSAEAKVSATGDGDARRNRLRLAAMVGVFSAVLAASAARWVMTRPHTPIDPPMKFTIAPAGTQPVGAPPFTALAFTPDGSRLVYLTAQGPVGGEMFVRPLGSLDSSSVRGLSNPQGVFVSPDGEWIGFNVGSGVNRLAKVAVSGGPPEVLCPIPGGQFRGATWGRDDRIIFASGDPSTGLMVVPAKGGDAQVLTKPDAQKGEEDHLFPSLLPDGKTVLFTITSSTGIENAQIAALDVKSRAVRRLIRGTTPEYLETGHLLYVSGGALRAVRFDATRVETIGNPVTLIDNVRLNANGAAQFAVSQSGTLAYLPSEPEGTGGRTLVWVGRDGREEPVRAPARPYVSVRVSPDSSKVALDVRDQQGGVWIWDFGQATMRRVTDLAGTDTDPIWTPDGARIIFASRRTNEDAGLYAQAADGTGNVEPLRGNGELRGMVARSITPDGRELVTFLRGAIGRMKLDGDRGRDAFPITDVVALDLSPDGKWLAYQSSSTGRMEIHVRPYPNLDGGHWQVTSGGGSRPLWSHDGHELLFFDDNRLSSVRVHTQVSGVAASQASAFSFESPVRLLNASYFSGYSPSFARSYDVSDDGQKFLMIKEPSDASTAPSNIVVVLHWAEELKSKLTAN